MDDDVVLIFLNINIIYMLDQCGLCTTTGVNVRSSSATARSEHEPQTLCRGLKKQRAGNGAKRISTITNTL